MQEFIGTLIGMALMIAVAICLIVIAMFIGAFAAWFLNKMK